MKKASKYLKQLFSAIVAAVKARSMAVGTKAGSLRTRLIVLSIMRNKKLLLSAIQSKIHAIMSGASSSGSHGAYHSNAMATGSRHHGGGGDDNNHGHGGSEGQHRLAGRKAAVLQNLPSFVVDQETRAVVLLSSLPSFALEREGSGGFFARSPLASGEEAAEDNDDGNGEKSQLAVDNAALPGSAVELARCAAEGGAEFKLEDEIDRVADVFIRRFHDQMKLQKFESFKRFCEMLEKGGA